MSEVKATNHELMKEARLPRRDWVLLPLIGVATILVLLAGTELTARRLFSTKLGLKACAILNDPSGQRGVPNSVCREKDCETPTIEYRFNSCGHRAGMECGPKPNGSYRIVLTGSSVAMGLRVAREQTVAALLPAELSREVGRNVEVYNTSVAIVNGGTPRVVALRFKDMLAAQPDMILWILTPWDVQNASTLYVEGGSPAAEEQAGVLTKVLQYRNKTSGFSLQGIGDAVADIFHRSRTVYMLQHYLFDIQSLYVKQFLMGSDDDQGFLKAQPSTLWKSDMQQFDGFATEVATKAKAAGVPLVVVLVPDRAQAAMLSMGEWPKGYDPYKLDNELRSEITAHGGVFIDILPDFRTVPNPERDYLPVDGHPNAAGHALIAQMIAKRLSSGAVPGLGASDAAVLAHDQSQRN